MNNMESDLKRCLNMISSDWKIQDNKNDMSTNFIYNAKSLDECLDLIEKNKVNKDYALHRWYNYYTSVYCEYLFCDYGAVHEQNEKSHDVDIYINNIPFDVKLTVYPKALSERPFNLRQRTGKNQMIKWYYEHQSQGKRKQMLNRLYIVCDGNNSEENLRMKSDFELLKKYIRSFMNYTREHSFNQIDIIDNQVIYHLYSDIIYIKK